MSFWQSIRGAVEDVWARTSGASRWKADAVRHLADREYAAAIQCLYRSLEFDPNDASVLSLMGHAMLAVDRWLEARASFAAALQLQPENTGFRADLERATALHLAHEKMLRGRAWVAAHPDDLAAALELGDLLEAHDSPEAALTVFQEMSRRFPDEHDPHNRAGIVLAHVERFEEAVAELRQAVRCRPDLPGLHFNLAQVMFRLERYQDAIQELKTTLRLDGSWPAAHYHLALNYSRVGHHEAAILCYEEAVRINGQDYRALCNLGWNLRLVGRHQEALERTQQALGIQPEDEISRSNLAVMLQECDARHQPSAETAAQAEACVARGVRLLERGDHTAEAEAALQEALRLQPHHAAALFNLGTLLLGTSRYDEAVDRFRLAASLSPEHRARAGFKIGLAYEATERYERAITAYRQSLQDDPDYALPRNNLIHVLRRVGRCGEAEAEAREARRRGVTVLETSVVQAPPQVPLRWV